MASTALTPAGSEERFCVLGASLDVGNRGVRALGVSLAQLLARMSPAARLVYHYGHASGGLRYLQGELGNIEVEVQNCRMSPSRRPGEHIAVILVLALLYRLGIPGPATRNAWLRSLLDARFIGEIRGGDSFSDIYGFRRFIEGCLPLLSVAILGRPYVLLPQTYGPFRSSPARMLAKMLLRRAAVIVTRDRHCEPIVRELSGRTPLFCPDVAFTMQPLKPGQLGISPPGLSLKPEEFVVGVNVSGLLYMGGYTGGNMFGLRREYRIVIDSLIDRVLSSTAAKVLLVPHVFGSEGEEEACAEIQRAAAAKHPGRIFTISVPLSEREIKWVIGQTHFFVGSRMHGCIAALSQGVPTIGLAYSDKFLGVFQSVGAGDAVIDLRTADTASVLNRLASALQSRSDAREDLKLRVDAIRSEVERVFHHLLAFKAAGKLEEVA